MGGFIITVKGEPHDTNSVVCVSQKQQFPGLQRLQDHHTDTAKNFQVPGFKGTVSFITSMTQHFCAGCNRLRLLADGNLKVCLFGPAEVSLRDALRSGIDNIGLQEIIGDAVLCLLPTCLHNTVSIILNICIIE
jgi:molybdenum cofactor biosynthesis enzyme MoaA